MSASANNQKVTQWLDTTIQIIGCLIGASYALIFFALGAEMIRRMGGWVLFKRISDDKLVATFLGVLLAFALARTAEWLKAQQEKKKKLRNLATGLVRTLNNNLGLWNQVHNEFRAGRIPTFPMDGGFLDYARPLVYELMTNADDASAIEHARYEIQHFDIKLEMMRTSAAHPRGDLQIGELIRVTSNHLPLLERAIRVATEAANKYAGN